MTDQSMSVPKTEPPGSPGKGKGRAREENDGLDVSMADWIPDPALWDKMGMTKEGAGTTMSALAAPVKTIEVRLRTSCESGQ